MYTSRNNLEKSTFSKIKKWNFFKFFSNLVLYKYQAATLYDVGTLYDITNKIKFIDIFPKLTCPGLLHVSYFLYAKSINLNPMMVLSIGKEKNDIDTEDLDMSIHSGLI